MRVGIIGLRPKQVEAFNRRHFDGVEINFYPHKTFTRDHIDPFCRPLDKVIVLQNLVPNNDQKLVPKDKRVIAVGSTSSILRVLETYQTPVQQVATALPRSVIPKNLNPAPMTEQSPATSNTAVSEGRGPLMVTRGPSPVTSVFTDVSDNRKIEYVYRENVVVQPCGPDGKQNYKILGAVQLGDIVRFERPKKVNPRVWTSRIQQARSYYKAKMGIVFEAHYYKNVVDLLATDVPIRKNFLESDDIRQELNDTFNPSVPSDQVTSPGLAGVGVITVEPEPQALPPVMPDVMEAVKTAHDALQRSFWKRAYIACLASGRTAAEADVKADAALRSFNKRFG